jgi:hypothetical protein
MASAIDTAKEKAKEAAQSQKDAAAAKLEEMSGSLSGRVADGIEQLSARLRAKDVDGLMRDAEQFARAQPLAFFGLAVAAGFLGVRYLKSSPPNRP